MVPIVVAAFAALAFGISPASAGDVTYYDVARGAHPHDVAPAPDGKVWYTAQAQGALGILDPKTGKVTQVSLGKDAALAIDWQDEVFAQSCLTHAGAIRHEPTRKLVEGP